MFTGETQDRIYVRIHDPEILLNFYRNSNSVRRIQSRPKAGVRALDLSLRLPPPQQ